MRRRDFNKGIVGLAASCPLAAHAQLDRTRRIGVLLNRDANDPDGQSRLAAFQQSLQQLGWSDGSDIRLLGTVRR
jgi:putative tryptophan/tyrosine transport system substrate-binding protein